MKLVGKTDIEDALSRLDKLTQEEVRMATAQLLKITHGVNDKVTRIDDRLKGVDDKVEGVDDKVKDVDAKLDDVGDTVKLVLDGTRSLIYSYRFCREFIYLQTARKQKLSCNRQQAKQQRLCNI